ncbi:hypothetical protein N0V86_007152 [Didymella sp. IMI 355093]|nr:hypothetical protein N0V86_007152 [Didymella sp. IMI 355093]
MFEAAEKELLRSGYLHEKRVLFPGDRDGFELNWLGNAPFMQAQVDPGVTQPSGPYANEQDLQRSEHNRLQALTLHVKLSDKAFLSGFNGKTHLKIEVLFNGQLSTCSLIHTNDIRSGAKSLHQIFAGYRVDFLAERPWVLLPPFTTADGGTRRFRKTITPTERWEEVGAAILKEAEERGTDKYGESPPSAAFLRALASMEMPQSVKYMQKPGGRKFGVLDVVITAGFGNKVTMGTSYLRRPQRLKDTSFAVRTEISSEDEVVAAEPDDSQGATDKILNRTDRGIANEAETKESDVLDERSRKRRAPSTVERRPQYLPPKTNFQSPLRPFSNRQIPDLPPPVRHTFQDILSPTAGIVSPRCPSLEHRSDGHKEPLPANDRNRTYNMAHESNNTRDWRGDASSIYQGYRSPSPSPELQALQTGFVNPALSSMSLSESANTHEQIDLQPGVASPLISSPMPLPYGNRSTSSRQPTYPGRMDAPNATLSLEPSIPFAAPTALMLSTLSNWSAPPHATTPPHHHPMNFQQQSEVASQLYPPVFPPRMRPNGLPDLLPQTPPLHTYLGPAQFTSPVMSSPPLLQPSGRLPPTAMFSVPSKPRQNSSPDKATTTNRVHTFQNSIMISRLVIKGRDRKPIVDYAWRIPQRICLKTKTDSKSFAETQARTSIIEPRKSLDNYQVHERNDPHSKSSQVTLRAISPTKRPRVESIEEHTGEQRRDSIVKPAIAVRLPYLKRHQGPANETLPVNPRIEVPDVIAPFVPEQVLAMVTPTLVPTLVPIRRSASPTQPVLSQRRAFSRNALPGMQGPKAATFLFDDPEEVLREAARMRRSRSPTKPAATPPVLSMTPTARVEPKTYQGARESSSPLSSVPPSPLSEKVANDVNTADAASNQIPQLDGSPERTRSATSPHKLRTPSPTKPAFVTLNLQRSDPATPQSCISQNSKKRKASHQSLVKPPRSPDRLKTVDNPPLNDNCVIALAESVDKKEERGILRQVKGERQGVFREEYVVLTVRFFVAGD